MKKLALMLILIQLIGLIPAANAVESWVLWKKEEKIESKAKEVSLDAMWEVIDEFAKGVECKTAMETLWDSSMQVWESKTGGLIRKVNGLRPGYLNISCKDYMITLNYYCLPETIDPRGK